MLKKFTLGEEGVVQPIWTKSKQNLNIVHDGLKHRTSRFMVDLNSALVTKSFEGLTVARPSFTNIAALIISKPGQSQGLLYTQPRD